MWLVHLLQRNSLLRPQALALSDAQRDCTWRELDERTSSLAGALVERGLRKGDRVMVLSANRVEVLELFFAAAKSGVIICPVNPTFSLPEIEYVVSNVRPGLVFAERSILSAMEDRIAGPKVAIGEDEYAGMASGPGLDAELPNQSDAAIIFNTSATGGRPKAVVVSHRSIMACYTGMAAETGMSERDIMLNPCPLFHGSMVIGLALLGAGGRLVLEREFAPQRFLADVVRYAATCAFLVPSMVRFVLAARAFNETDLSSLREILHGGAPMPPETLNEALARFPCSFRSVYGITEGGGPIALLSSSEPQPKVRSQLPTSPRPVGRMMMGAHLRVLDGAGEAVPPGEIGEICVCGDGLMSGYWNDSEATSKAVSNGWLHTGDLGAIDRDGFVFLVDRKNDLIIRGGQNIYPAEIERVIRAHPGVADVAALGVPSNDWGEVPIAFVVPAENTSVKAVDLFATCARELASYKRPAAIRLVSEIPRNAAGKILRRVLREKFVSEADAEAPRPSASGKVQG
jgi:acyl-CoA synthetase (AMP-forming)/AMP-acid ligase II